MYSGSIPKINENEKFPLLYFSFWNNTCAILMKNTILQRIISLPFSIFIWLNETKQGNTNDELD